MILDAIAQDLGVAWKSKFQGQFAEFKFQNKTVYALKPLTYMNLSGRSVAELVRFYKIPLDNTYVFHDDLDLAPGKIRLKQGGGNGGHNGLKSLDQFISPQYWRVRIGIGHPGHRDAVSGYVLSNFAKEEINGWVPDLLHAMMCEAPNLPGADAAHWLNLFNNQLGK